MFGARCDPPTPGAQGSGARTCAAPPLTVPALVQASPGPVLRGTRGSRAWAENGLRFCQPPTAVRSFPQRRRAAGDPGGVGGAPVTGRPRASSQRTLAAALGHRVTALMRGGRSAFRWVRPPAASTTRFSGASSSHRLPPVLRSDSWRAPECFWGGCPGPRGDRGPGRGQGPLQLCSLMGGESKQIKSVPSAERWLEMDPGATRGPRGAREPHGGRGAGLSGDRRSVMRASAGSRAALNRA